MTTLYWILEYGKVLFAYMFIMFIWPSVVFRKYLKGKSISFRFSFCTLAQVMIVNTVVLCLGLLKLLYPAVVIILFYGTFLFSIFKDVRISKQAGKKFHHFVTGSYGKRTLFYDFVLWIKKATKNIWKKFTEFMKGRWWEAFLLGVIVIFGVIYFSYGAFLDNSYGFGDLYTHNAWIYGLVEGKIFSAGVYPEGMHCFIYALHSLFGVRIYSCLLFTAGIHSFVFLVSAYVFLRQIFHWRYTPMLVLAAYLTIDLMCIDEIFSMSRLQWTLPQEFAFYAMFLCGAYLIRYLKSEQRAWVTKGKWRRKLRKLFRRKTGGEQPLPKATETKGYWDENLLVFSLALAATFAIHFYVTIMAFFLCLAFVPVTLNKIFNRKRFLPLMTGIFCGVLVAAIPMAGALASGIPFQGSIGWAMNVINGTDAHESSQHAGQQDDAEKTPQNPVEDTNQEGVITGTDSTGQIHWQVMPDGNGETNKTEGSTQGNLPEEKREPFSERIKETATNLASTLGEKAQVIYSSSYVTLYEHERALWIISFTGLAFALWFLYRIVVTPFKWITKKAGVQPGYFDMYFGLTMSSFIYMFIYAAPFIGLPELIAGSRLCSTAQLLILGMMLIPFDILFTMISWIAGQGLMKALSAVCVAGIYIGTIMTGTFHGYLYYELTRYNGAVMSTIAITESLPKYSYTIVSPVDELYQMIQYGYHEELVNFVNHNADEEYTLPSQYVFIFVEKKPIRYAQSHFFSGPEWLATEKYTSEYTSKEKEWPEVDATEISPSLVKKKGTQYALISKVYADLKTRTQLESTMYEWCQEFDRIYPDELHTYYEDEYFVCYYFKQNVFSLYPLGIQ